MTLLLWMLMTQTPSAGEGKSLPSSGQVVRAEKLMEATPSQRIRNRNLFHPTRGILLAKADAAVIESTWPTLIGTQLGKGHRGALLKWPGQEESVFVLEGEVRDGFRLEAVQRDQVKLLDMKNAKNRVLELDPERGEDKAPRSELEQLFRSKDQSKQGKS